MMTKLKNWGIIIAYNSLGELHEKIFRKNNAVEILR